MSFYGAATNLFQSQSRRPRSIIDIVTISNYFRVVLILTALAITGQLQAQDDLPAPEPDTETAPSPELPPGAPVQIHPDEGTLGAGEISAPFYIGRRLQLSASIDGGYDDNVLTIPNGSPSWFANPNAIVSYQFGSPRLALDLLAHGGIIYYFDHPGGLNYDPVISLEFTLAFKVAPRLTLDFSTSSFYGAQPDITTALSSTRRLGNYISSENQLFAHYRLSPRLSSITGYAFYALEYENSAASGRDRMQDIFSEQLRYLLMPTTTVLGGYRFSLNESQNAQGESHTQSLFAGLEQSFSPRLRASLHGGVQFRSQNNAEQISPYVQTSLVYEVGSQGTTANRLSGRLSGASKSGAGTYIIWTNSYSLEESDLQRAAGRETFRTNLALNVAMTARISASLALNYSHGDNQASNQSRSPTGSSNEETFGVSPSVRYAITPRCAVNVGYSHTDVNRGSGAAALDAFQSFNSYTRNRYFAGVNISF